MEKNEEIWEFIFKEQIENEKSLITEDKVGDLKGCTTFKRPYKEGQRMLRFLEISQDSKDPTQIKMSMDTFMYPMELKYIISEFMFMDAVHSLPTLVRKGDYYRKMFSAIQNTFSDHEGEKPKVRETAAGTQCTGTSSFRGQGRQLPTG